jgi:hypothetical protein
LRSVVVLVDTRDSQKVWAVQRHGLIMSQVSLEGVTP